MCKIAVCAVRCGGGENNWPTCHAIQYEENNSDLSVQLHSTTVCCAENFVGRFLFTLSTVFVRQNTSSYGWDATVWLGHQITRHFVRSKNINVNINRCVWNTALNVLYVFQGLHTVNFAKSRWFSDDIRSIFPRVLFEFPSNSAGFPAKLPSNFPWILIEFLVSLAHVVVEEISMGIQAKVEKHSRTVLRKIEGSSKLI